MDQPTYYNILRKIIDHDYELCEVDGVKTESPDPYFIGILKPREPLQKALFIGGLRTENDGLVLEIYGRENVPEMREFGNRIRKIVSSSIETKLASEEPQVEMEFADFERLLG